MSFPRGLVLVVAGAAASAACVMNVESQGYVAREEKRFEVATRPDVHLVTFDGSIEVRTWDRNEVLVEIEKRGHTREAVDSIQVTADQTGNRVQLEARRPPGGERLLGMGFMVSRSARLIATIPKSANVLARTGDGTIRIERVDGRIELRTEDGSVKGSEISGDITVDTGDGSVVLQDIQGRLDARSGDGGLSVSGRLGVVRLSTDDGSVTARVEPGSTMGDDWSISTGDGGVVLYLPGQFDAEVDAHSNDGRVSSDLEVSGERSRDRQSLRGRLGSGGHALKVRTGDGNIHLRVS